VKGLIFRLVIAFILTISAAIYQRLTGPTHPVYGDTELGSESIDYKFNRSHDGEGDQPVIIAVADTSIEGYLVYRRYKANEAWKGMKLQRNGPELVASLPHQPPAGKLEYFLWLNKGEQHVTVPDDMSIITRFTGAVPLYVLLPHILIMFVAMFMSMAAGLEAIANGQRTYIFTLWTTGLLFLGGMILGPIVQKFAFDAYWTGFPWGMDLTDNKTLVAMIAWILAAWRGRNNQNAKWWVISATIILLIVYLIPHSLMGSELNYETMKVEVGD
jgi:hypothetical protein